MDGKTVVQLVDRKTNYTYKWRNRFFLVQNEIKIYINAMVYL